MSLLHNQTAFLASFWRQSSPHTAREDAIRHSDRDCAKTSPTKRNSTTNFSIAFDASVTWFPPDSREILFFFLNLADDESLRVGNIGLTRFWSIVDLNR